MLYLLRHLTFKSYFRYWTTKIRDSCPWRSFPTIIPRSSWLAHDARTRTLGRYATRKVFQCLRTFLQSVLSLQNLYGKSGFFQLQLEFKTRVQFQSTINIIFDRVGKKDAVTRGIEIAVHWCGFEMDVAFWSQHVSFFLVGCIVVTSIRGLLLTLTKFFYKISSSKSSNIIVLVMAQIMGMYFCSSVLLMRMNMPAEYRIIITEVLGGLHFNFYHRWFDTIFLVSSLATIVVLYLLHKPLNQEQDF